MVGVAGVDRQAVRRPSPLDITLAGQRDAETVHCLGGIVAVAGVDRQLIPGGASC